jgi:hypothetical protein
MTKGNEMTTLSFDPATFDKAEATAKRHGTSIRDIVNGIINGYAAENETLEHAEDLVISDARANRLNKSMKSGEGTTYKSSAELMDHMRKLVDE